MIVLHVSKYFDRSSRTSSESRASESAVKPTRSANSTETSRRSETGAATSPRGPTELGAGLAPGANGVPHSPQNFTVGGLSVPQLGQASASDVPHSPQNLRPPSFSAPHASQRISYPPPGAKATQEARDPRCGYPPSRTRQWKASDADSGPREVRTRTAGHANPRPRQPSDPSRRRRRPRSRRRVRGGGGAPTRRGPRRRSHARLDGSRGRRGGVAGGLLDG